MSTIDTIDSEPSNTILFVSVPVPALASSVRCDATNESLIALTTSSRSVPYLLTGIISVVLSENSIVISSPVCRSLLPCPNVVMPYALTITSST